MFRIENYNPNEEAKTLQLSNQLFHEALNEKPESMIRLMFLLCEMSRGKW